MSLYIHIPFCISKCAYCDFFSKPCIKNYDDYITALCNEIKYRLSYYKISELDTIYIGGGTPSLLNENQFREIFDSIRQNTKLSPDVEITVEVNPDDVTKDLLDVLNDCGVTRISCGIQSMNDAALKKACRRADSKTNQTALTLFEKHWKKDLSIDLISGLPGDDEKTLKENIEKVCAVNPCHISLYSLTIEEETPFGKQLAEGKLSYDFDAADKLWLCGRDILESRGYNWYEVSNFCKPEKECHHNLAYWNHKDYLGCGSGATGTVYSEDGKGLRWTNKTDIDEYTSWWLNNSDGGRGQFENLSPQVSENIDLETSEFEFFMM